MTASSDSLVKTVSKDDIICYCFSVTYEEAEKLFEEKKVESFDRVPIKTSICSARGCRACELNIKEHFFPEELGGNEGLSSRLSAGRRTRDLRSMLSDAKTAIYRWIDLHAPMKQGQFRYGFPVLMSDRIRTYFRLMNISYPEGDLPIADQDLQFSFYDASGNPGSQHQATLRSDRVETYDLAEISDFDASSPELGLGYCWITLVPKSPSFMGTLRGYVEFKTPNHTASLHEHGFSLDEMRFFVYRSKGPKGRYYMLLHNTSLKPAKLQADLSDQMGTILGTSGFELPARGSGIYTLEDFFPRLAAAALTKGRTIRVTSTQPVAPTFLFWDQDSGLITVQHH